MAEPVTLKYKDGDEATVAHHRLLNAGCEVQQESFILRVSGCDVQKLVKELDITPVWAIYPADDSMMELCS